MAKRLTETEKWDDVWYYSLPQHYMLLWCLMLDKCNAAGIYDVDLGYAGLRIKHSFDTEDVKRVFQFRIHETSSGMWFVPKFIAFHYRVLSEKSRLHRSVIAELKKAGVWEWYCEQFPANIKKMKPEVPKKKYAEFVHMTETEFDKLVRTVGSKEAAMKCVEILDNYKGSTGREYASDYRACLNWVINEYNKRVSKGDIRIVSNKTYVCPYCHDAVLERDRVHHWQSGVCKAYRVASTEVVQQTRQDIDQLLESMRKVDNAE